MSFAVRRFVRFGLALTVGAVAAAARTESELPLIPYPQTVVRGGGRSFCAQVEYGEDAALAPESYRISVGPEAVRVVSSSPAGRFYAKVTLEQLRGDDGSLPCVEISDAPAFRWRGVLLDESRHFFGKATVKRVLDRMASCKLNVFHWHLVDSHGWRIALDRHPELAKRGSTRPMPDWDRWIRDPQIGTYGPYYYTKDDLREIVDYAAARHIRIVPEIEIPGHSRAVLQCHPDFFCRDFDAFMEMMHGEKKEHLDQVGVVCLGNDDVLRFFEEVLDEVCEIFPGDVIHIGGDECPRENWKSCPKCQERIRRLALKDEDGLQSWATRHFVDYLAKKGRKALGWDEILSGGLAEGALVMSWRGAEGGIAAADAGHDVIMCPHRFCYLDYRTTERDDKCPYPGFAEDLPIEKVYSLDLFAGIPEAKRKFVIGTETLNWTESTWREEDLFYKMWPRTYANAELAWTGCGKRTYADFSGRLADFLKRKRPSSVSSDAARYDPAMAVKATIVKADGMKWIDGRDLPIEGRAFDDVDRYYDRLPSGVTTNVNAGVRAMKSHTAGMQFRFRTDSRKLTFVWTNTSMTCQMDNMPLTGNSAIDVYRQEPNGIWRYVTTGRIGKLEKGGRLVVDWPSRAACLVNLPLYNGIASFSLGVDAAAKIEALPPRKSGIERPVVFYGTSITQGGCATRPGMAFASIVGRDLDVPIVNLGFSGSGWMELEMASHLARIDASCYVLDCLWNMSMAAGGGGRKGRNVDENYEPFVRALRAKRPGVPIVMAEMCDVRCKGPSAEDRFIRALYEKLVAEGWKDLVYLPKVDMYVGDGEGTVDGVHPNDWGMMSMAKAFGEAVREALGLKDGGGSACVR